MASSVSSPHCASVFVQDTSISDRVHIVRTHALDPNSRFSHTQVVNTASNGERSITVVFGNAVYEVSKEPLVKTDIANGKTVPLKGSEKIASATQGFFGEQGGELLPCNERLLALSPLKYRRYPNGETRLEREFRILSRYQGCEGIAQARAYWTSEPNATISTDEPNEILVMHRYDGDLEQIQSCCDANVELAYNIAARVFAALKIIHAKGDVHRDIKPPNILTEGDRIAITDFSFCKTREELENNEAMLDIPTAGAPLYAAPEIVDAYFNDPRMEKRRRKIPSSHGDEIMADLCLRRLITPALDMWAMGLVMTVLFKRSFPLPKNTKQKIDRLDIFQLAKANNTPRSQLLETFLRKRAELFTSNSTDFFPEPPDQYSITHLIWELLQPKPENRISSADALLKLNRSVEVLQARYSLRVLPPAAPTTLEETTHDESEVSN